MFIFILYVCKIPAHMYVYHLDVWYTLKRGCWFSFNWSYRFQMALNYLVWVLGTKSESSSRVFQNIFVQITKLLMIVFITHFNKQNVAMFSFFVLLLLLHSTVRNTLFNPAGFFLLSILIVNSISKRRKIHLCGSVSMVKGPMWK